uniref:Acyl-coenzyme A diphosphatase NUDT19 n=1 Tax=Callorhinchus milii TaxID=7868 RepID=V9KWE0_CALMI
MNTLLKHWKEAATVVLAAGTRKHTLSESVSKAHSADPLALPLLPNIQRDATAWARPEVAAFDYAVLLLQRSGNSKFMPNAHVFPGGQIDPSDFSSDWIEVFWPFGQPPDFNLGTVQQTTGRSPIYATDRKKLGSPVPGEIGFRICAIRETFEESGVLLVRSNYEHPGGQGIPQLPEYEWKELEVWRARVQKNPVNFLAMCRELSCIPDIWALKEWNNWLTPTGLGQSRRYDTAFFICCVQEIPFTTQDKKETVLYNWLTPHEALERFTPDGIWLPPPQYYELSRLCHFPSLQGLHEFSRERELEGCECWLPVRLAASDGFIQLLPGDELYPNDPHWMGEKNLNLSSTKSAEELCRDATRLHRIKYRSLYDFTLQVNIEPKYKHIHPLIKSNPRNMSSNL